MWIHGGGLLNGSSNQHDGSKIVWETGVVVLTLNYRLGVFGFLGHTALTAEAGESGNYGEFEGPQELEIGAAPLRTCTDGPDRATDQ